MTNIQELRKLITGNEDAIDLLDEIAAELKEIEQERDSLQKEIKNRPETKKVFIGPDTLHYRLENDNLRITQQLEDWLQKVKQENIAGALI